MRRADPGSSLARSKACKGWEKHHSVSSQLSLRRIASRHTHQVLEDTSAPAIGFAAEVNASRRFVAII